MRHFYWGKKPKAHFLQEAKPKKKLFHLRTQAKPEANKPDARENLLAETHIHQPVILPHQNYHAIRIATSRRQVCATNTMLLSCRCT